MTEDSKVQTKLSEKTTDDTPPVLEQVQAMMKKKLRNIEKRKGKLLALQNKVKEGEQLNEDQQFALKKIERVIGSIEIIQEIQEQLNVLQEEHDRQLRKQQKRERLDRAAAEMERMRRVYLVQNLLFAMGDGAVRSDFQTGARGAKVLSEEELDRLDELYQLTQAEQEEKPTPGSLYAHIERASANMYHLLEARDKPVEGAKTAGLTYRRLWQLVDGIEHSGYFRQLPFSEDADDGEQDVGIPIEGLEITGKGLAGGGAPIGDSASAPLSASSDSPPAAAGSDQQLPQQLAASQPIPVVTAAAAPARSLSPLDAGGSGGLADAAAAAAPPQQQQLQSAEPVTNGPPIPVAAAGGGVNAADALGMLSTTPNTRNLQSVVGNAAFQFLQEDKLVGSPVSTPALASGAGAAAGAQASQPPPPFGQLAQPQQHMTDGLQLGSQHGQGYVSMPVAAGGRPISDDLPAPIPLPPGSGDEPSREHASPHDVQHQFAAVNPMQQQTQFAQGQQQPLVNTMQQQQAPSQQYQPPQQQLVNNMELRQPSPHEFQQQPQQQQGWTAEPAQPESGWGANGAVATTSNPGVAPVTGGVPVTAAAQVHGYEAVAAAGASGGTPMAWGQQQAPAVAAGDPINSWAASMESEDVRKAQQQMPAQSQGAPPPPQQQPQPQWQQQQPPPQRIPWSTVAQDDGGPKEWPATWQNGSTDKRGAAASSQRVQHQPAWQMRGGAPFRDGFQPSAVQAVPASAGQYRGVGGGAGGFGGGGGGRIGGSRPYPQQRGGGPSDPRQGSGRPNMGGQPRGGRGGGYQGGGGGQQRGGFRQTAAGVH